MNAFGRSAEFIKVSMKLLGKRKWILLFPIISIFLTMGLNFAFKNQLSYIFGPGLRGGVSYSSTTDDGKSFKIGGEEEFRDWAKDLLGIPWLSDLSLNILLSIILIFFNTALTNIILKFLGNRTTSFWTVCRNTALKFKQIIVWGILSALILFSYGHPFLLKTFNIGPIKFSNSQIRIEYNLGLPVVFILLWMFLTYFIAPILVFEEIPLRSCFKRSFQLLAATWKEQLIFQLFIIMVFGIIQLAIEFGLSAIPNFSFPVFFIFKDVASPLLQLILAVFVGWLEISFCAVLYSYAITGMSPKEFIVHSARRAKAAMT